MKEHNTKLGKIETVKKTGDQRRIKIFTRRMKEEPVPNIWWILRRLSESDEEEEPEQIGDWSESEETEIESEYEEFIEEEEESEEGSDESEEDEPYGFRSLDSEDFSREQEEYESIFGLK